MFLCVKYEFISPNFLTTSTWKFIQLHTSIIIAYCNSLPINLKCWAVECSSTLFHFPVYIWHMVKRKIIMQNVPIWGESLLWTFKQKNTENNEYQIIYVHVKIPCYRSTSPWNCEKANHHAMLHLFRV